LKRILIAGRGNLRKYDSREGVSRVEKFFWGEEVLEMSEGIEKKSGRSLNFRHQKNDGETGGA